MRQGGWIDGTAASRCSSEKHRISSTSAAENVLLMSVEENQHADRNTNSCVLQQQ